MKRRWIATLLALTISACAAPDGFTIQSPAAKLRSPAVNEASGMADSPTRPDLLWIVNDSGGTPDVHLAGTDGSDRGKLALNGAPNIDWEDLAAFKLDGNPYLLVADTGDNVPRRDSCVLYIVREPKLPADGKQLSATAAPAWTIRFRYEDGPRDCEAVAVDAKAGKILLISKRTKPPVVYELPLRPTGKRGILTASRIGTTEVKPAGGSLIPFFDQPTGLDISADGSLAAVVTYHGVFVFSRNPSKEPWADAFAKAPLALPPHRLSQAESVAISPDGKTIRVISEGTDSPIKTYQR
jgi:hypothetical protein